MAARGLAGRLVASDAHQGLVEVLLQDLDSSTGEDIKAGRLVAVFTRRIRGGALASKKHT